MTVPPSTLTSPLLSFLMAMPVVLVTSNLPFLPVLVSVTVSDAVPVSVIAPVLVPVTVLVTVWPFRSRVRFLPVSYTHLDVYKRQVVS